MVNMVNIPKIWSTYQKYGQHTRNMVIIPEIWSKYEKYGQSTGHIVNIPEIWSKYQKYGQHTRYMVKVPKIRSTYQKFCQYTRRLRVWKRNRKRRKNETKKTTVRSVPIGSANNNYHAANHGDNYDDIFFAKKVQHVLALAVDPLTENIFYILDVDRLQQI